MKATYIHLINKKRFTNTLFFFFFFVTLVIYPLLAKLVTLSNWGLIVNRVIYFLTLGLFFLFTLITKGKYKNTGIIWLWVVIYLTISLLLYSASTGSFMLIYREFLFSIVPFIMYAAFTKYYPFRDTILKLIVLVSIFAAVFGFLMFLNINFILFQLIKNTVSDGDQTLRLFSYTGPIFLGYLSVTAISILLFNKSLFKYQPILFFVLVLTVIVCGQRSPIGGLVILFITKLFYTESKRGLLIFNVVFILMISALLLYLINRLQIIDMDILDTLNILYASKFETVRIISDRTDQQQIFNTHHLINILFGEGFGKYSQENEVAIIAMSDAGGYRLYNEIGFLGLILYMSFFINKLFEGIKQNNPLIVSIILYTLFASFFNRILFAAPMSFIPFIIIAVSNRNANLKI